MVQAFAGILRRRAGPCARSQAAVDVDNRQDAADIAAALTVESVDAVISGMYADFRPDVAPLVVEIPFDARVEYPRGCRLAWCRGQNG